MGMSSYGSWLLVKSFRGVFFDPVESWLCNGFRVVVSEFGCCSLFSLGFIYFFYRC